MTVKYPCNNHYAEIFYHLCQRIFALIILLITLNISTYSQINDISLTVISIPDSIIIGEGAASCITNQGDVYYLDNSSSYIVHFNSAGELIKKFGRKGMGPGEFMHVNDMFLYEDKLYVLDHSNSRIQVFDSISGQFIKTIMISNPITINSEIIVDNQGIQILGFMFDNEQFVHMYDFNGNYKNSFGNFIDFSEMYMNTSGRIQLTQLHADYDKELTIYTIGAPYKMFAYDNSKELVWSFYDPTLPEPWKEHIIIKPDRYTTKFYPTSFNSLIIDDYLLVYYIDPEKKECFIDLRDKNNGELITRKKMEYNKAPIAFSRSDSSSLEFYTLLKNRQNNNMSIYKLSLDVPD